MAKPIKSSQLFNALIDVFSEKPVRVNKRLTQEVKIIDDQLAERHPLRILLAEDHPTNQMLASRILQRMGYRPDVAADGYEVLQALAQKQYDVILMDIQMPRLDGVQTTQQIRENEREMGSSPIHIVAMTANAMTSDRDMCYKSGMNDYVSKPIRIDALVDALENVPTNSQAEDHALHGQQDEHTSETPEAVTAMGTPSTEDAQLLDPSAMLQLYELTGEDFEFLAQMIDSYLTTSPDLMHKLRTAIASDDATAARLASHTLKSGSADMGAIQLQPLFAAIEAKSRENTLAGTEALLNQVDDIFQHTLNALEETKQAALNGSLSFEATPGEK